MRYRPDGVHQIEGEAVRITEPLPDPILIVRCTIDPTGHRVGQPMGLASRQGVVCCEIVRRAQAA
jgi:hypothetical protein